MTDVNSHPHQTLRICSAVPVHLHISSYVCFYKCFSMADCLDSRHQRLVFPLNRRSPLVHFTEHAQLQWTLQTLQ